jgi:2-oxoglutarate/2-oxoacid ferredoxin oxidoreductase subunit beta
MFGLNGQCPLLEADRDYYTLEDYTGTIPRWCPGCGDNAILSAVQKLCRDEQLPPERTVFVSGIGCSSRFPHYMKTYGFHGLHGRALPIAEGIKIRRPDLHVFVNTGDGDCASIGTAHWIHAIRYNMNMTVMLHDNEIYGMTKFQVSPTTRYGMKTNTTPYGSPLRPLNILSTTLGVSNVSFVANVVEWVPELLYQVIKLAYRHRGFSFVRIIQRCPHFVPGLFDPLVKDPDNLLLLAHPDGMQVSESLAKVYKQREEHDPSDINRGRELASLEERVPVGILYRNPDVPCYEDQVKPDRVVTTEMRRAVLERELDKFAVRVD